MRNARQAGALFGGRSRGHRQKNPEVRDGSDRKVVYVQGREGDKKRETLFLLGRWRESLRGEKAQKSRGSRPKLNP